MWRILHKHNLQHDMPTKGIQTKTARKWLAKLKLPSVDRLELDHLLEQWDLLERQLEQVDRANSKRHARNNKAQFASTMPGLAIFRRLSCPVAT